MHLRIPGKTFLVGEYAVLVGGSALAAGTEPYFVTTQETMLPHPDSAAGLYLKKHSGQKIENPYGGGFGLSTAEFIAAWFKKNQVTRFTPTMLPSIFKDYRQLFSGHHQVRKPSGADLVTQVLGKMTVFNSQVELSVSQDWCFKKLGFGVLSTGIKIPTHEHLAQLDLKLLEDLPDKSNEVLKSFQENDELSFLENLKNWKQTLAQKGLQHHHSIQMADEFEKTPEVLLAKPNGALGADTMTVFFNPEHREKIHKQFKFIASDQSLGWGAHYVD